MAKIKLPYPYKNTTAGVGNWQIVGWEDGNSETGRLVVKEDTDETKYILPSTRSFELLQRLGINPKQIPSRRTETVSGRDWERFQRFIIKAKEIEEISDETLYNWKCHLEWLQNELSFTDNDNEMEDIDNSVRKLPRLLKYVRTGHYLPDDMDDEDMTYFDDNVMNYQYPPVHHRPRKVVVHIEEIPTNGEL